MEVEIKFSDCLISYADAMIAMEQRVNDIVSGADRELIWFLEHDHVFTAGSGEKSELDHVVLSGRGGRITYHGPGQRVVYLMLDLRNGRLDLKAYLRDLEMWAVRALTRLGIDEAHRVDGSTGVWVKSKKIASIGIRARKWVVFHGIAINVSTDMEQFARISPCGMNPEVMTSLRLLGCMASMAHMDECLIKELPILMSGVRGK